MSQSTLQPANRAGQKTPPGPRGNFLFGSLIDIRRDPLEFLTGLTHYGDIVKFRFFMWDGFLLNHPDHIKHVLVTNNRNYNKQALAYQMLKPLVGEGLLTSDGDLWLSQRRLVQPAFHRQRINTFAEIMTTSTAEMLSRWQSIPAGQAIDISEEMMRLTLSIVGKSLFSQDIGAEADVVGRSFSFANEYIATRTRSFFAPPLNWPTPGNRRFHAARNELQAVVRAILAERRQAHRREAYRREAHPSGGTGSHADLLDMLLHAVDEGTGQGMTDQRLQDEVMTLLLAGHETTANALTWTWYLLSQNPPAEQRLHAELDQVLGERLPTLDDLPRLPYTRMVIQESMRLYPPAWIISRKCIAGDILGGYPIPPGGIVELSPYLMHRHPGFWPDPERFDPQRFTPQAVEQRPAFAYFPFGGGPRLCIGRDFAMLEAQLVLATVARRFRLRLQPGHPVELEPLITLRPRHGMKMLLEEKAGG